MEKIFVKHPAYYRMPLIGSVVYFGHQIKVKDEEYITLSFKSLIEKIDEVVEGFNDINDRLKKIEEKKEGKNEEKKEGKK